MQTQTPPLQYLNDETYRITEEIEDLRSREHIPVLYTMDAGPTVHLFCTEEAAKAIREYAHTQKNCKVFEAKAGNGAQLV
jgi:mevalonate pyrophosphate decarboxylase